MQNGWHAEHRGLVRRSQPAPHEFINRNVFPDGQLDTVSNTQRGMKHARFEIADVEVLRQDVSDGINGKSPFERHQNALCLP